MWQIAICDDQPAARQQIAALWQKNFPATQYQLHTYTNGQELLQAAQITTFALIYLDICMPEPNGLAIAQQLRDQNCSAAVIFLTNYNDYLEAGYEVQAFRYRFKPLAEDLFLQDIAAWQKQYQPQKTTVQITTEAGTYQLALQDIIYVEIVGRKVQLVTTQGTLHSTEPMQHWEQILPAAQFLTPYNKILVNLAHVKFFDQTKLITTGDYQLPISRRKYQQFKEAMLKL